MQMRFAVRRTLLCLAVSAFANLSRGDSEKQQVYAAINILDHYLCAAASMNPEKGAFLLESYQDNERRAIYDTRRMYKKKQALLENYLSIKEQLYGYEIRSGLFGTAIELEGGIETENGITAEYQARIIYRQKRWMIDRIKID